jgi:hypothetical protein
MLRFNGRRSCSKTCTEKEGLSNKQSGTLDDFAETWLVMWRPQKLVSQHRSIVNASMYASCE